MIIEEGFGDTLKKISKGIQTAKNTYDYYTGKRDTKYNFAETAPWSVINATDWKPFKNDGTKYKAYMDRDAGRVRIDIDAENVGNKAAPLLNPKSKDNSLLKYLKGYDKSKKVITLIMPVTNKNIIKRLKDEEDFGRAANNTTNTADNNANNN